jgi:hypothetical protein
MHLPPEKKFGSTRVQAGPAGRIPWRNQCFQEDEMRSKLLTRGLAALAVATAGIGLALTAAGPAAAADESMVSVVHGIPGQNVDVYVNGSKTLDNFKPGDVAGPLKLAAGTYDIALTKPGDPVSSAILENKTVAVPAGKNLSLVANLDTAGKPALNAFVNDTSTIPAGMARLTVRHTAQAPAVDVRANGKVAFAGLTNPNEAKADLPAGTIKADVVAAGTATVVLGPTDLNLKEGTSTIVYATGSLDGKTLTLVAQTITGLGSAPGGMPAGSGGQAGTGVNAWWYVVVAAGVLLLAGGGVSYAVRRRR